MTGITALLLAAAPGAARATTIYTYTGLDFTTVYGGIYTTSMHVTGSLTLNGPLAANLGLTDISSSLLHYHFSDGVLNANDEPPMTFFLNPPIFEVATDASGNISAWSIQLSGYAGQAPYTTFATINTGNCCGTNDSGFEQYYNYNPINSSFTEVTSSGQTSSAGKWTTTGDLLAVPEPGALSLLVTGLAGLCLSRRRPRLARPVAR